MVQKSELVEMSMSIVKASFDKEKGVGKFRMVCSDTGEDVYGERMSLELFNDFTSRIGNNLVVPEPYKSILSEKSGWEGGMPYVSVSHYKSGIEGKNIPADTEKVYVDGECLKATAICRPNPLGEAVFNALKADIEGKSQYDDKIRVSIGFLDLAHSHGDYLFERNGLANNCPMCENGVGNKIYLKGILVHLALTRKPANPRTDAEVDKAMTDEITTREEDAESIVGKALTDEIIQNKSTTDDVESTLLTVKSEEVAVEEKAAPAPMDDEEEECTGKDGCTCKACAAKKKKEKSALDESYDTLKSRVEELKSMSREDALREIQPMFEQFGQTLQAEFVEQKSAIVVATIDPALNDLLMGLKTSLDTANSRLATLSDEVTILKSKVGTVKAEEVQVSTTPDPRNIQVTRSVNDVVAKAFAQANKPMSILEIAQKSVQN